MTPSLKTFTILAGSYTSFINTYSFVPNGASSSLTLVGQSNVGPNPSWIALHPQNKSLLFSTDELEPGFVSSYVIGSKGLVTLVDKAASLGDDPAHLAILSSGKEVIVPNYTGGNVQSHILGADQAYFASSSNLLQFNGSGPNPDRQLSPHPHEAVEYGNEVLIPDLGSDKVWRLVKSPSSGNWSIVGYIQQPLGSGPRHIVPYLGRLFTVHELSNTLTEQQLLPAYGAQNATLIANISTLPSNIPAGSVYGAAELVLSSPSSANPTRYLYASNRNVSPNAAQLDPLGDTIAIFAIDPKLQLVKQVHTGLQQIRALTIGGDQGQYIAAAGLVGGGVAVFERVGADLTLLARYNGTGSDEVTSFAWL